MLSIVLWFLLLRWLDSHLARKGWQANPAFREPLTYIFSPLSVKISSAFGSLEVGWKHFVAAELTSGIIYLTSIGGEVHILPKRAFRSPEDRRTFQQLAEAMVPTCRF
jgi:hypothetical protein